MSRIVLRIDTSARRTGSVSRSLVDETVSRFNPTRTITRDLAATPIPQVDEAWVTANFTPVDERNEDQAAALALSDALVDELKAADTLAIGLPIYNFGVPAALKAWIDQIARAGVTFRYSDTGPIGLLEGKRAIVVVASGGTKAGSDIDYATGYIRHVLGFIGITDVSFVTADQPMIDTDATMAQAADQLDALDLAA